MAYDKPARTAARRRRRQARLRRRIVALLVLVCGLTGAGFAALSGGDSPAGSADPPVGPRPALAEALRGVHRVPGALGRFPWPAKGQSAVAVLGRGVRRVRRGRTSCRSPA